jgi:hypothetical protein
MVFACGLPSVELPCTKDVQLNPMGRCTITRPLTDAEYQELVDSLGDAYSESVLFDMAEAGTLRLENGNLVQETYAPRAIKKYSPW